MLSATRAWQAAAAKWRDLAERRSAHHIEMFESGRWSHYYSDERFLVEMKAAVMLARRWGEICPNSERSNALAGIEEKLELALSSVASPQSSAAAG